jgi:NAD(P)H dehydrogenase (quinone)
MIFAVTGATGHLGTLAIDAMLERGIAPKNIVAVGRSAQKLAELEALGVQVRAADYTKPDTLAAAFAGVDRLLFISGSEVG